MVNTQVAGSIEAAFAFGRNRRGAYVGINNTNGGKDRWMAGVFTAHVSL